VMMATLVVGPFYLARSLGLGAALVGIVMSVGPLISTVTGLPAGRLVDRWGARQAMLLGLCLMVVGAGSLALIPGLLGVAGYIAAIAVLTPGYQLFQAANNTGVMMGVDPAQRGVIAGTLSLSRNLGLITGAAAMGAIFAAAAGTSDITLAEPAAIAHGLRVAFGVAAGLIALALGLAASSPKK
jgi:MFS family permease